MKKVNKLLLASVLTATTFSLVSCGGKDADAASLLSTLILETTGYVDADFSVVANIEYGKKTYDLTWTSDNECLRIADKADASGSYAVKVTRPEDDMQEVTLTAKLEISKNNVATKDFEFNVYPIDVYDFIDNFVFEQNKSTVYQDFDLPTKATFLDKEATISWASSNEEVVKIEDSKALVNVSSVEIDVNLTATFAYKNETAPTTYSVKVCAPKTPFESLMYWYENTGISQTISGYIVEFGEYSDQYDNITLYVLDDTMRGGYYIYRVGCTPNEYEKMSYGSHVTITGTTNTDYNGLIETNAGGTVTVDEDVEKINVAETVYALDNDLIANAPTLIYRTSTLVSLTNWKVKELKTTEIDAAGSSTQPLFVVEKDGAEITICYSKYPAPTPLDATNANFQAINSKFKSLQVGDYVNIQGLLGNYNGAQIVLNAADSIKDGVAPEGTMPGKTVGEALNATATIIAESYNAETSVNLPTESNGVTISWSLLHDYAESVSLEGNTLTVSPTEKVENAIVVATYTYEGYTTEAYYTFTSTTTNLGEDEEVVIVPEYAKTIETGVAYKMMSVQGNKDDATLYFTGSLSGNYGATSEDYTLGADFYLESAGEGFNLYFNDGQTKKYVNAEYYTYTNDEGEEKSSYKIVISATASSIWALDTEYYTLTTTTSDGTSVYLGTYSSYTTFSASKLSYASTSFVSRLYKTSEFKKGSIDEVGGGENPEQTILSIKDAKATSNGTIVTVQGTVSAVNSNQGFILYDGEDAIQIYTTDATILAEATIGTNLKVTGERSYYNGDQIKPSSVETISDYETKTPTATTWTVTELEAYRALTAGYTDVYVTITGTLTVDGNYVNLTVSGSTKAIGSLYVADKEAASALADQEVVVTGWVFGVSGSKYVKIMTTSIVAA